MMVAYSFQPQFAAPILALTKTGTVRAIGKRAHAKPGDELQLYRGMRTRSCHLIARANCAGATPIRLDLEAGRIEFFETGNAWTMLDEIDGFARGDGFENWRALHNFWTKHHPGVDQFDGVWIRWKPESVRIDGLSPRG